MGAAASPLPRRPALPLALPLSLAPLLTSDAPAIAARSRPHAEQWVKVACASHCLGLTAAGAVWSWGRNDSRGGGGGGSPGVADAGQLGRMRGSSALGPVDAAHFAAPLADVAAGRYFSAAIDVDGNAYTWGLNDFGQLGRPGVAACLGGHACRDPVPTPVPGLPPLTALTAGRYHVVAIAADGSLLTWGLNACGLSPARTEQWSLDVAARPRTLAPAPLAHPFVRVDAGYHHTVALDAAGRMHSCATGFDGYAGAHQKASGLGVPAWDGGGAVPPADLAAVLGRSGPALELGVVGGDGAPFAAVCAGRSHSLGVSAADGTLYACGTRPDAMGSAARASVMARAVRADKFAFASVGCGEYHSVGLTRRGEVVTFGSNAPALGRAGAPADDVGVVGPEVVGHGLAVAVAAGYQSSVALVEGGWEAVGELAAASRSGAPWSHGLAGGAWASVPADVRAVDPHLFDVLAEAEAFEPAFRNPCLRVGGALRCLPFFQILGVSKCGTTNLFHQMMGHPQLSAATNKGPHWWDERRPGDAMASLGPIEAYLDLFAPAAERAEAGDTLVVAGEASSNTFTYAGVGVRGKSGGPVALPTFLAAVLPAQRHIVVFREPISRFISAYFYYNHEAPTEAKLVAHTNVVAAKWAECVARASASACARSLYLSGGQQLVKGMYAVYIDDWLAAYPASQFLWLKLEDYKAAPRATLARVYAFLGVDNPTADVWAKVLEAPTRNTRRPSAPKTTVATLDAEARAKLMAIYGPLNAELAARLGRRFDYNVDVAEYVR